MNPQKLVSYNPATGEIIGNVPVTPLSEISQVVASSQAACIEWGKSSHAKRKEVLLPFGERLHEKQDELAALLTAEMGKPLADAYGEIKRASKPYSSYLDEIEAALSLEVIEDGYTHSELSYVPYGVCVAISPWNFPLYMPHWMVMPALMAGNTV
ncbi:MAG: aldehyde dehydrogenase family protein, partial [Bdellovibrionales bacterium]|nr:aldehyde dehydrogenase family protein [Bdellovibrionales bacterium]